MTTDVDAVVFEIDRSGDAPDLSVCFDDGDVRHPGGLKLQRGGQPCRPRANDHNLFHDRLLEAVKHWTGAVPPVG